VGNRLVPGSVNLVSTKPQHREVASGRFPPSVRLAICASAGVAAAAAAAVVGPWWLVPLTAWDVAAGSLFFWTWAGLWSFDGDATAAHATTESPSRVARELVLLIGSVMSLIAVGLVVVQAAQENGLDKGLLLGVAVISIVLGWATVHTVFTLRYAKLYYQGKASGVDWNASIRPDYFDFAYLALTIGMTFQVSDTDLTSKGMRRLALRHALLSYMFGSLIIASTINLMAGLGSGG
jgi:uncharacterized membrane protein